MQPYGILPILVLPKSILSPNLKIYTAVGTHMFVSHSGMISNSSLNVENAYLVPKLSLNFILLGKVCGVGLKLNFLIGL